MTGGTLLHVPYLTNASDASQSEAFCSWVRSEGERLYRDLPWRNTRDAYAIWISEAMLQQTQVSRVLKRWERFLRRFPTIDALASASNADVLEEWQGLGYNRRALNLKRAADICSVQYAGAMPKTEGELEALPGIGKATAAGILAFAYDEPAVYIETNVRAVYLEAAFPDEDQVSDSRLRPFVQSTCPAADVRGWYYALLDIGAQLKAERPNPSRRASAYTTQSRFEGSRRQKRAWIVREVLACPGLASAELLKRLNAAEVEAGRECVSEHDFDTMMQGLASEGFFSQRDGVWNA